MRGNRMEDIQILHFNHNRSSMTERASILKKKGMGANGQFQTMHLAVFPYHLQFLKDVDHSTTFYFQKKYQVIGKVYCEIPPNKKGAKYPFRNLDNIIHFRLFSQGNVVYQWSAYRVHDNGEEEFMDCCTVNLKEQVANFVLPQASGSARSVESLINLSFIHTELKLKFAQLGVILSVVLLVADDPNTITDFIEKKYVPNKEQHLIPQINLLKLESSNKNDSKNQYSSLQSLHENKRQSQEQQKEKSSFNMLKYSSKDNNDQSKEKILSSNVVEDMDLDNMILTLNEGQENLNNASLEDEFKQITLQIQQTNNVAKQTERLETIGEQHSLAYPYSKELQVENEYKQGILKLQSDQVKREKQDSRLQYEELQAIEEEDRSNKQTFSPKFKFYKKQSNPFIPKTKQQAQRQKDSLSSDVKSDLQWSWRTLILLFLILTFGALGVGIAMRQMDMRKRYKIRK